MIGSAFFPSEQTVVPGAGTSQTSAMLLVDNKLPNRSFDHGTVSAFVSLALCRPGFEGVPTLMHQGNAHLDGKQRRYTYHSIACVHCAVRLYMPEVFESSHRGAVVFPSQHLQDGQGADVEIYIFKKASARSPQWRAVRHWYPPRCRDIDTAKRTAHRTPVR